MDPGLHRAAEARSPPPSRLLTEEVEDNEEEGRLFISGLGTFKVLAEDDDEQQQQQHVMIMFAADWHTSDLTAYYRCLLAWTDTGIRRHHAATRAGE